MPYVGRQFEKAGAGFLIPGGGDAMSSAGAEIKVLVLGDILQDYFMARGESYDGSNIGITEVKKAILYARGKKFSKVGRKAVIGTAKLGLAISGATVGSIVPVAGTAVGWLGGMGLGAGVTAVDYTKRGMKKFKKGVVMRAFGGSTLGKHREQAAAALFHMAGPPGDRADGSNPAVAALVVLLGEEFDQIMEAGDVKRIAQRLKSN